MSEREFQFSFEAEKALLTDIFHGFGELIKNAPIEFEDSYPIMPPFHKFKDKHWDILAIMANVKIKRLFVNVEIDDDDKISRGTTGLTTLTSKEYTRVEKGEMINSHIEEWITWQTLMRMWKKLQKKYHAGFLESSYDAACIAALEMDGMMGWESSMQVGVWRHHW